MYTAILDLDRTLYATGDMLNYCAKMFVNAGCIGSTEDYYQAYIAWREAEESSNFLTFDGRAEDFFPGVRNIQDFLPVAHENALRQDWSYPGVKELVSSFADRAFILTRGNPDVQEMKIRAMGIDSLVPKEHIRIVRQKDSAAILDAYDAWGIRQTDERIHLNDHINELRRAISLSPFHTWGIRVEHNTTMFKPSDPIRFDGHITTVRSLEGAKNALSYIVPGEGRLPPAARR